MFLSPDQEAGDVKEQEARGVMEVLESANFLQSAAQYLAGMVVQIFAII